MPAALALGLSSSANLPDVPSTAHLAAAMIASLHSLGDLARRSLRHRIARILTLAALPQPTPLLGLYLLRRAFQLPIRSADAAFVSASPELQFLAALAVAHKWVEDAAYTNRTWSELAADGWMEDGLSSTESLLRLNAAERGLLARLTWEIRVDPLEFANWTDRLGRWASSEVSSPLATTINASLVSHNGYPDAVAFNTCIQPMSVSPANTAFVGMSQLSLLPSFLACELIQPATLPSNAAAPPVFLLHPAMISSCANATMQPVIPRPWSPAWATFDPSFLSPPHYGYCSGLAYPNLTWAVPGA